MPFFDPLKKLRYFRDWFRPRPRPSDSYIESVPEPTVTYPNQVYEDKVHSFIGGEEQTYRNMQIEIDRHVSHISIPMQAEYFAQASVPEANAEELFVEHEPVLSDAELIEMAIEAVKEDTSDELEDIGFADNGLEDIEQAFDQPDDLVEPALEKMIEEMMYDQAMDEPEMEDAQQADYMPLEVNPFFLGG